MLDNNSFILSSIKDILQESANLSLINCKGIEAYPLQEYILQSTLLKMTGYSEQKLKCICWDIASIDYEFRYQVYQHWSFGECSSIDDKNNIFCLLIKKIQEYESTFTGNNIKTFLDANVIAKNEFLFVKKCIKSSCIKYFAERDFRLFSNDGDFFKQSKSVYISEKKILSDETKNDRDFSFVYTKLYKQRNRCAHNLTSYQQNLPKTSYLLKKSDRENFFHYFTILVILDEVFMVLYKKLSGIIQDGNW